MAPKRSTRDSHNSSSKPIVKVASNESSTPQQIISSICRNYLNTTPQRIMLTDIFLAFLIIVGVLQFVYCLIVGNYPFNAFLSGFSATVGQFVLTTSLRIQTNRENEADFEKLSPERAFADYVFGSLILHFFCVNFIN
ncbi:hypothetical protein K3495_g11233 [Podosphaera aphanis]|nr:hypothetical protein K3495_g11233 [Podosphaera aphanis]